MSELTEKRNEFSFNVRFGFSRTEFSEGFLRRTAYCALRIARCVLRVVNLRLFVVLSYPDGEAPFESISAISAISDRRPFLAISAISGFHVCRGFLDHICHNYLLFISALVLSQICLVLR